MRLALFTDTYAPDVNGVARTLEKWEHFLRKRDIPCLVFAPNPASAAQRESSPFVERFMSMPFVLYPECRLALPNPIHMRRALEQFQPTLIHVATPFNMGLCGVHYARKHNIPLVASYHTHFDRYLAFYNIHWMVKMLWRYLEWFHQDCRRIFVPSASTLHGLAERGWDEERLSVWTRGIETKHFHPNVDRAALLAEQEIAESQFVVLYVGRMAPEKNVDTAVAAFAKFQREVNQDAVFVLAGDGPQMQQLKQQAVREGINTRLLGFTGMPKLQQWYAAADVLLFPSPTETFGNVVLEAMACGTPVICADSGGVVDTVNHEWNGLLCEPGNADAFCEALERIYLDEELRKRLVARGLAHSMRQSWEAIFEELLSNMEQAEQQPAVNSSIRHIGR
ncbi:glycosyltransferase family 1 protein [Paenibacillus sp. OV219]|uniref:glycosyltransferase family 4 protein n=1 Tax=Paenibacillus sp. OV219 TaxID=1884377 RepID=UPI0008D3209B|nr:glycosyltransferase family 1 protein [Paenibacillus sp. OV219]SEN83252.1 Glycosyltransferase involved in cell wall bisynthesis [Paenibacillus sp. OV219]